MREEHTFTITWSVPEEQWEKAQAAMIAHQTGSPYDQRGLGRYYLLYGDVDLAYDGDRFYGQKYGPNGINVSLFDFAVALADAFLKQRFVPEASATYDQLDDNLQIHFVGEGDAIRVTASDHPEALRVPRAAFLQGILGFLCGLASAIKQRLGKLIEWESMAPLKEVMVKFCVN
jgi:hypothetical protein